MVHLIDGHLDLAWNALSYDRDQTCEIEQLRSRESGVAGSRRGRVGVSLPEMRKGGVGLCFGSLLARSKPGSEKQLYLNRTDIDYASQGVACGAVGVDAGSDAYQRCVLL